MGTACAGQATLKANDDPAASVLMGGCAGVAAVRAAATLPGHGALLTAGCVEWKAALGLRPRHGATN